MEPHSPSTTQSTFKIKKINFVYVPLSVIFVVTKTVYMELQEQLVNAFLAWEKTNFTGIVEREEYNRISALAIEQHKKELDKYSTGNSCNMDDEDCLSCGS